ncbi:TRAP transporter substrate-binding protein DctP [Chloroflexota bacterium]
MDSKKMKYLIFGFITSLLTISLLVSACAPAAPTGNGEAVKPAEVFEWDVSTYAGAGVSWDVLPLMAEYLEDMSDGRMIWSVTAPGVICPVEEQMEFVAMGSAEAMSIASGYYSGKIPIAFLPTNASGLLRDPSEMYDMYEVFEGGRMQEIFEEEYAKFGDIHIAGNLFRDLGGVFFSKVPVYTIDDIKGVKWRASEQTAKALDILGAATTWVPGSEIYTLLATGAVDTANFGGADTNMKMSFHEVTNYWLRWPSLTGPSCDELIVNGTAWNKLPSDLRTMVEVATAAGTRYATYTDRIGNARAFATVSADYGIELIRWSEEDANKWSEALRIVLQDYIVDDATQEAVDIMERFMIEMGYWE